MTSDGGTGRQLGGARVGVDIGGTFTDIVLCLADGRLFVNKTSSTPDDPGTAVITGLQHLLAEVGLDPGDVVEVVHGTTVASNTILQRSGAATGVLATRGFRDVLEIARIRTPDMFDLTWDKPEPLAPRRHRLEVDERIGADGGVVRPLREDQVVAAGERFQAEGVETVAVCFLNSYVNPEHEREAQRILGERFPGLTVTASCDVLPEIKEYERTSTTVVNAYILPAMRRYLANLSRNLAAIGITAPLQVVASNGGMIGTAAAADKPVYAVASGPAAGIAGAARLGRVSGEHDLIVFDMGGTTAKASLVEGGQPSLTSEYEFRDGISTPSRFVKGGGYMLKVPAIDVAEVGSGGGSIAHIDEGGLLRVGPLSAGADPGPACYGLGNERPTVTDANVVLGFINPASLAGGTLALTATLAEEAIRRHVAEPLGLSLTDAAHGIREVANVNMARALRAITIERGRDPRGLALMAFGGNGPVHAADVARLLGIRRFVAPLFPGVFSALGMLAGDVEHHFVRSLVTPLAGIASGRAEAVIAELAEEGRRQLAAEGFSGEALRLRFQADLRYRGQSSELTIPLAGPGFGDAAIAALEREFAAAYRATYGYASDEALELVNLRLTASGERPDRLDFAAIRGEDGGATPSAGKRQVCFARGAEPVETPIHDRGAIGKTALAGPAILESYDSTIVVPPGASARRDANGSIVVELAGVEAAPARRENAHAG